MKHPEDPKREEDVLESLLSADQLPEDADADTRELFRFVQACREAAQAPTDTARVVSRSLSISTREDLTWRGDARDISRFVKDRLRSSAMLRLAAASLLLHLAALPVVALYVLTEEPALPEFRVEVGERSAPFDEGSTEEAYAGLDITEPSDADELLVENSLRWARYQLDRSRPRLNDEARPVCAWLLSRSEILYGPGSLAQDSSVSSLAEPLLQLERVLDQHLVGPRRAIFSAEDEGLLDLVAKSFEPQQMDAAWLVASALARAESYGLSTRESAAALKFARDSLPREDARRPLIEVHGDVRALMPIDPLWLGAVREFEATSVSESAIELFRSIGPGMPR